MSTHNTTDDTNDYLGVRPILTELNRQRAQFLAADEPERADDIDTLVDEITRSVELLAESAANDGLGLPDEARRNRTRSDLHEKIREHAFVLDIDLTRVPLGMYPLLPYHSYDLHLNVTPLLDRLEQLRRDAVAAGDRDTAEKIDGLAEGIAQEAASAVIRAESNTERVPDLKARREEEVAAFEKTVTDWATQRGVDLSDLLTVAQQQETRTDSEKSAAADEEEVARAEAEDDLAARQSLQDDLMEAMNNDAQFFYRQAARQLDALAAEVEAAGHDTTRPAELRHLARVVSATPANWDGESFINPEAEQQTARTKALEELRAANRRVTYDGPLGPIESLRDIPATQPEPIDNTDPASGPATAERSQADDAAQDDGTDWGYKSDEEHFEESMDALYAEYYGDADSLDDAVEDEISDQDGTAVAGAETGDNAAEEDDRDLTRELVVDPAEDVVWGGVVMSRAQFDAETEPLPGYGSRDEELAAYREMEAAGVDNLADLEGRGSDTDLKAATDQSACSVAVTRASATVQQASDTVEKRETVVRDEKLARWSDDDQASRQAEQTQTTADTDVPW